MADGPTPAKTQKLDTLSLPECPYGTRCYRKNPQHFKEYSHGVGSSNSGVVDSVSANAALKPTTAVAADTQLPPCKYGVNCYRKNLLHFAEFSHPTSNSSVTTSDVGSDTDIYDSDDGEKPNEKTDGEKKDILSKDLSLVKRFSQLTDEERKDLIKRAIEEKLRLQQELDGAKKIVEEKNKELENLQRQMNVGLLMVEGEEEALKKTKTTYFPLLPERAYKEGSASQIHFRLAESQFYRLVTGDCANQIRVTKVEYLVSPKVVKRFREYQANLKKERGVKSCSILSLVFTELTRRILSQYVKTGFKLQVYECKNLIIGSDLVKGYDSHMSPCKKELVIFHSAAILPCYIIYFTNAKNAFTYAKTGPKIQKHSVSSGDICKASAAPASKIFKGMTFTLSGKLSDSQANLFALIEKHGGSKGTNSNFDILITSEESCLDESEKMRQAKKKSVPVVCESYLYDCIGKKKKLHIPDYVIDD